MRPLPGRLPRFRQSGVPRSWVPFKEDVTQTGLEDMEHEGNQPRRGTDDQCPGDGQNHQQLGTRISIRPKLSMPPTVLVTELDNGTLILQGRPDGPRTSLKPDEAVPLRLALAMAFDSPDLTPSIGQGEAP